MHSLNTSRLFKKAAMISSLALLLLSVLTLIPTAHGKEIEATNEWQVMEEGDTIPAGLHVRMDLETGTKWVKLIEEESNDSTAISALIEENNEDPKSIKETEDGSESSDIKITHLTNTQVDPNKSAKITSQLLEQAQQESKRKANLKQSISSLNDFDGDMTVDELDYEMMYRTLMKLPDEERQRLDVPQHPFANSNGGIEKIEDVDMNDEQNVLKLNGFIAKIKDIWNQRQEALKQLEEEYLANVPDIIQERIATIKEYLSSPVEHLKALVVQDSNELNDSGQDTNEATMNILESLEDLEFHLMDIDMARDFHIMGGWPLLISLLTDNIHSFHLAMEEVIQMENITSSSSSSSSTTTTTTDEDGTITIEISKEKRKYLEEIQKMIWKVQSLASWSIGTAVKNIDEFHPWALEDMSNLLQYTTPQQSQDSTSSNNVNVVSILLSKMKVNVKQNDINYSPEWLKLKQKEIYALGSLLRGNKFATYYFDAIDGPHILGKFFDTLAGDHDSRSNIEEDVNRDDTNLKNTIETKLLNKVMMLGVDLIKNASDDRSQISVGEEGERTTTNKNLNHDLITKLSDETWCSMPWKLLSNQLSSSTMIQRQVAEALTELSLHCDYSMLSSSNIIEKYVKDAEINDMMKSIFVNKGAY